MDFKRFLLAAILFMIVAQVFHTIGAIATMGFYSDPSYLSVWSKIMMPSAGPPPAIFYYLSAGFGLITSMVYVYAYTVLKKAIPGKEYFRKGVSYGALLFLIGTFPGSLSMILLINIPVALVIEWALEGMVISMIGGILIARLMD